MLEDADALFPLGEFPEEFFELLQIVDAAHKSDSFGAFATDNTVVGQPFADDAFHTLLWHAEHLCVSAGIPRFFEFYVRCIVVVTVAGDLAATILLVDELDRDVALPAELVVPVEVYTEGVL